MLSLIEGHLCKTYDFQKLKWCENTIVSGNEYGTYVLKQGLLK